MADSNTILIRAVWPQQDNWSTSFLRQCNPTRRLSAVSRKGRNHSWNANRSLATYRYERLAFDMNFADMRSEKWLHHSGLRPLFLSGIW